MAEFEKGIVGQGVEEDRSLDIFEMTNNTSEPTMKLIIRERASNFHALSSGHQRHQMSTLMVGKT